MKIIVSYIHNKIWSTSRSLYYALILINISISAQRGAIIICILYFVSLALLRYDDKFKVLKMSTF